MDSNEKERYVRWQEYRINQLTFSINLFLSFGVASLAYAINLNITQPSCISQSDISVSIYWWSVSVVLGTIATLSRLLDFRYTARKIKDSSEDDKCKAKMLGKLTWFSFWAQIIAYVIGGYQFVAHGISL